MKIKLLEAGMEPWKRHKTDAGLDLRANESLVICPGEFRRVNSGICVEIPLNHEGHIRPRSSSFERGLYIDGTIDPGYTGEVKIQIINIGNNATHIAKGDRIAQLIISPCLIPDLEIVEELSQSDRGNAGFGSTGRM